MRGDDEDWTRCGVGPGRGDHLYGICVAGHRSRAIPPLDVRYDAPGTLPHGFIIGRLFDGRPAGDWKVVQDSGVPSSPHVFGQMMREESYKASRSRRLVKLGYIDASNHF